jgi:hypothetical protein
VGAGLRLPASSPTVSQRLRHPPRRAPLAAPPACKGDYSSASVLVRWVLDYSSQDILPPEAWSLRLSASLSPSSGRGCAASVVAQPG